MLLNKRSHSLKNIPSRVRVILYLICMAIPVFHKRKLIGSFDGEFYGDDFCILESRHEIPGYPGITGKTQVIANVLYDNRNRKAGLEVAWIEGLQFIEGYKPRLGHVDGSLSK